MERLQIQANLIKRMTEGERNEPTLPEILAAQELLSAEKLADLHEENPKKVNPDVIAVISGIYDDALNQGSEGYLLPNELLELSERKRQASFKSAVRSLTFAMISSAGSAIVEYKSGYEELVAVSTGLGLVSAGLMWWTVKRNSKFNPKPGIYDLIED